jgi:hypothetical protein
MSSTMLQLMGQVTGELGIPTPATVIGNPVADVTQLLALMNACGYELIRAAEWRALAAQHLFSTEYLTTTGTWTTAARTISGIPSTATLDTTYQAVGAGIGQNAMIVSVDNNNQVTLNQDITAAGAAATVYFQKMQYDLPNDYASITPRTQWDKSKHWEMLGPETPQQWEWLMSGFISTGLRLRWRLYQSYFQIWPGFSNAEQLGYEYRSLAWVRSSTDALKNSFTLDSDTCIFPDRLMVLATKLKYFEAKGFDTTAMYRNYSRELDIVIAQDTSAANLSFAPSPGSVLITYDNIPDSGYGSA